MIHLSLRKECCRTCASRLVEYIQGWCHRSTERQKVRIQSSSPQLFSRDMLHSIQRFRVTNNADRTTLQSGRYRIVAAFLLDPRCRPETPKQKWRTTISNTVLENILKQSTSTSVETSMNPPLNRSDNPEGHFCIFDARRQPELEASPVSSEPTCAWNSVCESLHASRRSLPWINMCEDWRISS